MDELWAKVEEDAGDPAFAELAGLLRTEGKLDQALEVCLAGLSANPGCHQGRLVLAHVLYQKGYYPFVIRELEELHRLVPGNRSVRKLLEKLSPGSVRTESVQAEVESTGEERMATEADDTIAEAEFDFDMIDMVDEDEA